MKNSTRENRGKPASFIRLREIWSEAEKCGKPASSSFSGSPRMTPFFSFLKNKVFQKTKKWCH
ncbi:hypothetical protein KKG48_00665, partial [Patescibacteria group bacterium]|nr:hypothetical protein [Patescibacteria group bacterium]